MSLGEGERETEKSYWVGFGRMSSGQMGCMGTGSHVPPVTSY